MKYIDLPKFTLLASVGGLSLALIGIPLLPDGTSSGSAFAQASMTSAERETPSVTSRSQLRGNRAGDRTNLIGRGGFARESSVNSPISGDVTPAIRGNVTPAIRGNVTPAIRGNVTPAFTSDPTPPVGSGARSTSIDSGISTRTSGAVSGGSGAALSGSASATDDGATNGVAGAAPSRESGSASARSASTPNAAIGAAVTDAGRNADGIAGIRTGRTGTADFVIIEDAVAAGNVRETPAKPFAIVCQTGCEAPAFIMIER